jgi:hypothetical protein
MSDRRGIMMIAKQGILITHAIALTALLVTAMGWQVQIQEKSTQTVTQKNLYHRTG